MLIGIFMNRSLIKFFGIFLAIIFVIGGAYFVWDRYFSEAGQARRFIKEQTKAYEKAEKAYIEAMTADTYGGKTPEETLKMFVDALRKEDVELASKYFMLDENLSRDEWEHGLKEIRDKKELSQLIKILENTQPAGSVMEGFFGFEVRDKQNNLITDIDMRFNKYSQIWKIESL